MTKILTLMLKVQELKNVFFDIKKADFSKNNS